MYKVDVYLRVRRAVMVDGMSIREASRVFGLHRDTVRKMLVFSVPPGYLRQSPPKRPKLEPFTGVIDRILEDDLGRPRKQRHTAKRIFERLREEYRFDGQYTIVKDYVREHRRQSREMFVPLSHAPGHAQCDFCEALVIIGGVEQKAHCFVVDLPHSDGCFVKAYPAETTEAFLDGHVSAFAFLGGVPQSILYDNTKLAVARILGDGRRKRTRAFTELQSHYLFSDRFGRPGKGNDKGKVEGMVGYMRRNFLVPVPSFESFDALNAHLEQRCLERMDAKLRGHSETIGQRMERDLEVLLPLPPVAYDACEKQAGRVSSLSLVRYRTNDYSAPVAYGHRDVLVRGYVDQVVISCGSEVIAKHHRSYERDDFVYDPIHYLPLLERKPGALDQAAPLQSWELPGGTVLLRPSCRCSAKRSALTGQHKCHTPLMENVTLTQKEQARLQVLNSLLAEHMTLEQAATLMGVTTRHTRRILAAYRELGAAAVAHGHRGRRPPNATPEPIATAVVHLARTRYAGANHTHLSELLSERDGIDIGRTTLRRILVNAGLSSPRRRRPPRHRVRRQRMPREGMLIQLDGSYHRWLGDDGPQFTILFAVDDATGTVVDALFCEQEDAHNYFLLLHGLVQHLGIPVALYTDRHGVFRHTPGSGLPGMATQFSRAMEELGIQMIFALSPQAKGRVERTAGTFQDRLVTELRLASAGSIWEANRVLDQFLPRFNRRFRVHPQHPEPAFRPLDPELCLEQVLCFKHPRRVARDNTVRFQLHTLQLLPGPERHSYAGAVVEVLEGLDGRLSVRHEGGILASQEAPPSPVFLRNGHGRSAPVPVAPSGANGLGERWTAALQPLDSRVAEEKDQGNNTDSAAAAGKPKAASPRKPTFLQRERWKAIQKARREGMSLRAIERELGIHRATIKKYLAAESPPTRQAWDGPSTSSSDTMAA